MCKTEGKGGNARDDKEISIKRREEMKMVNRECIERKMCFDGEKGAERNRRCSAV